MTYNRIENKHARRREVQIEVAAALGAAGLSRNRRRFLMEELEETSPTADAWIVGVDRGMEDGSPDTGSILAELWASDRGQLLETKAEKNRPDGGPDLAGLTLAQRINCVRARNLK